MDTPAHMVEGRAHLHEVPAEQLSNPGDNDRHDRDG